MLKLSRLVYALALVALVAPKSVFGVSAPFPYSFGLASSGLNTPPGVMTGAPPIAQTLPGFPGGCGTGPCGVPVTNPCGVGGHCGGVIAQPLVQQQRTVVVQRTTVVTRYFQPQQMGCGGCRYRGFHRHGCCGGRRRGHGSVRVRVGGFVNVAVRW